MNQKKYDQTRNIIREKYSKTATSSKSSCGCSSTFCCDDINGNDSKVISLELGYSNSDVNNVPEGANMGLGCGNPKAIASLKTGEIVVDLGAGGGFDCFLAAKEVGGTGKVIGVDMTPDMVSKARENAEKGGYKNVEFRLGEIEYLPIANDTADVIISNCVINLSPEKQKVFNDAYRVLKPGGRLAISDVVATAELPQEIKNDIAMVTGCVSGASLISDLEEIMEKAGFEDIRIYPKYESKKFIKTWAPGSKIEDYVVSATIEAVKPK